MKRRNSREHNTGHETTRKLKDQLPVGGEICSWSDPEQNGQDFQIEGQHDLRADFCDRQLQS